MEARTPLQGVVLIPYGSIAFKNTLLHADVSERRRGARTLARAAEGELDGVQMQTQRLPGSMSSTAAVLRRPRYVEQWWRRGGCEAEAMRDTGVAAVTVKELRCSMNQTCLVISK